MVRFAEADEIRQIIELWCNVFGDSPQAVQMFLDTYFKCENTVVYCEDDRIVSMLFLLEGYLNSDNQRLPSYYLYAACTDEKFRGKGIMNCLIKFAEETAKSRGYSFIFLLPAEDSLYGYYEKFGFTPLYGKKSVKIKVNPEEESALRFNCFNYDKNDLASLRNKAFTMQPYFEWSADSIDYAVRFNDYYSGNFLYNRNGYLLYAFERNRIIVKETTFTGGNIEDIANYLLKKHRCSDIVFNLPTSSGNDSEKFGMALPLDESSDAILKNNNKIYLGLTLD